MPRHKNSGGCIETMSRSEASPIQTIQFHHPSLSALSPLPIFIQSIRVMLSFPPFPLFFLVYLVIKKRDKLTRTLYCTETRIACVHTNFHTKCSSCKDWQLNIEVDSQSAPLLEKFTNSFCKPCHSSSIRCICLFNTGVSPLCNYDVLWLLPPCRRAWSTFSLAALPRGKCPLHVNHIGL